MSTHNINFHDKIKKKSLNMCLLELSEEFRRDSKTSSDGKRAIGAELLRFDLSVSEFHLSKNCNATNKNYKSYFENTEHIKENESLSFIETVLLKLAAM